MLAVATLALSELDVPIVEGADTTTSSTIAGPVLPLTFPVQGRCSFIDTFGSARSGGRLHEGVDLIAKAGQFVYAAATGTLTKQYVDAPGSLSGNGWRLTAGGGTYYFYAHLSGFAAGLQVGSTVVAGQIIGYVGATGNAGTPHLHFEIHPGGGPAVNPTQSVKAVDGCAVTSIPTVATNPPTPAQVDSGPPQPTLAKAVRIPASASTVDITATTTTNPGTTVSTSPGPPVAGTAASRWTFIEPVVVFNGTGATALVANTPRQLSIAGLGGISSATTGLMLRVSTTAAAAGTIVVHPCGSSAVGTTLSVEAGPMAIGTATVPIASRSLCVTSTVAASVKLTATAQVTATGVGARPTPARRVLDTRSAGRLAAGQRVAVPPTALGAGSGTKAVTATFTLVDPSAAGTLSISACGGTELKAPFVLTPLAAFSATVAVNAGGLCVSPSVATDVIVDITGGFDPDAGGLTPVAPVRVLGTAGTPVAIGTATTNVNVAGVGGLPAAIGSAALHVTVTATGSISSVFVWPCDQPRPAAAVGVVPVGRTATFSAITTVVAGQICVAANAPATAVVDVSAVG